MDLFDILTMVTTSISLILTVCTISIHFIFKEMINHPGHLVLLQCVLQIILDLQWYTSIKSISNHFDKHTTQCEILAVIAVSANCMFFSYLLGLTIEILLKLKNATIVSYSKRNRIYHCISVFTTMSLVIPAITEDQLGKSHVGICSLRDSGMLRYIFFGYIFACIAAVWVLLIYMWKDIKQNSSSILFNYALVVISVSITVTISNTMEFLDHFLGKNHTYRSIGILFGSLTGTCIALSRLGNRLLLKKLYYKLIYRGKRQLTDSVLSVLNSSDSPSDSITFLGEFFENITKTILYKILSLVYLRLEINSSRYITEENSKFTDYKFEKSSYQNNMLQGLGKAQKHSMKNAILREYMPRSFNLIRESCGVDKYSLQQSMGLLLNNFNINRLDGGSSRAFIFTTYDDMYVIKTITGSERRLLLNILQKYLDRVLGTPKSKLIRILGLYKLIPENQDFIIMENIIPYKEVATLFDLKGSLIDRFVETPTMSLKGVVLKDQNFIEHKFKVFLNKPDIDDIINTIKEDFEILKDENIMDYSILLAIYDNKYTDLNRYFVSNSQKSYAIGIIDILQEYNFAKISEERFKKIYKKNRTMISVAEPTTYYLRIVDFLAEMFSPVNGN